MILWQKLQIVTTLSIKSVVEGVGIASVHVEKQGEECLIFREKGEWLKRNIAFTNTLRWSLDASKSRVRLDHLRRGVENPLFLLEFVQMGDQIMEAKNPHRCGEDCYFAKIEMLEDGFVLDWKITGPKKNEHLELSYSH